MHIKDSFAALLPNTAGIFLFLLASILPFLVFDQLGWCSNWTKNINKMVKIASRNLLAETFFFSREKKQSFHFPPTRRADFAMFVKI